MNKNIDKCIHKYGWSEIGECLGCGIGRGEIEINASKRMKLRHPIEHDLKCWPEPFELVRSGFKPWEYRRNDRDFREGDTLLLRAWDPKTQSYLGNALRRRVILVFHGVLIPEGFVVMTLAE